MKKSLLFLGLVGTVAGANAQSALEPAQTNKPVAAQHIQFDASRLQTPKGRTGNRAVETFWINYASSIDQVNGGGPGITGPAELNSNYLFPDSTVNGEFGAGNFSAVWVHHLGDILDVKADVFDIIDGMNWDATTAYSVDSMSIVYGYTRNHPNTAAVDTLVITLMHNGTASNLTNSGFIGATAANYGTDTVSIKIAGYDPMAMMMTGTGKYTFKVPLTAADTAITFYRDKMIALPASFSVPAGKLLVADVMFKPGYTYNPGDQIDYVLNAFFFTSYEEKGAGTFQTYFDCNYQSVACDYNSSSIVPIDVQYGTAATWNNKFIPSYAYTAPYGFEHHLISYRVTSAPVGISEAAANDFALNQNQPNPFKDQTSINFQLKKSAEKVSVEIYNVAGVRLFDQTRTDLAAGSYSVDINTSGFASGLYFYSLTVDGVKVTKKMIADK